MPTHAAFLRGVNLGPRRRAGSAELRAALEGIGLGEVATVRTSGNLVFAAGPEPAERLTERIEAGLEEALGFQTKVFVRTADELRRIAGGEPFPPDLVAASKGKLQVSLLDDAPGKKARDQVLGLATDADRLAFGERELYWLPSGRMRESGLDLKAIETLLGPATMRTMGTMEQLAAKFFADD